MKKVKIVFKNDKCIEGELICELPKTLKTDHGSTINNICDQEILYIEYFDNLTTNDMIVEDYDPTKIVQVDLLYESAAEEADSRIEQIKKDREDLAKRMKDLNFSGAKVSYGTPSISAFKVPQQYSTEKVTDKNRRDKE